MAMNDNPPNKAIDDAAPQDEELVAYLDGELDAESARRIEALLASNSAVRQRLQSLERTWDLLDELDVAPLGEPFTQTTLEMVAVAAREEVERGRADAPRQRRRFLVVLGIALLAAAATAFAAVAIHDPDRQLLRDLPVLENIDEYRQIGSIDFLHRLRKEGLFLKDAANPSKETTQAAADDEDTASRRRVANMTLAEKEQLVREETRFASLTPATQQRLRRLHEDLQNDPEAKQLRAVMHAYCQWLKPLPPLTCADLTEGEVDDRIAAVKKRLKEELQRDGGWRPDAKDMTIIRSWLDDCATRHEADFAKSIPTDRDRSRFLQADKAIRHQVVLGFMRWQWQGPNPAKLPPIITAKDLSRLNEKLGPDARQRLDNKTPLQQWRIVATWMRQGIRRTFEDRRFHGPFSQNDDERLAEFFEALTDEQRDRLLSMPGEEMQWELQQLFWMRNRPPEGPGRRNGRPGDHDWPGPMPQDPPPNGR
jgi:hypothetical protein